MLYRLITVFLWPLLFLYTTKIALRDKSSRYFFQRLGFAYTKQQYKTIWIHCASVGETNTYMPLHLKLVEKLPDTHFIITTNTCTGASTVKKHAAARTSHCYLPIESAFAIKRFLKACSPERCLIMETEIWPLLYHQCAKQNITLSIINARLSHKTLNTNNWIKSVYKNALKNVGSILCKSENEVKNFKILGAEKHKLTIAGNLKFTHISSLANTSKLNLNNRNYCVAASTHNDEEKQLAQIWAHLSTEHLLVIAPRHPNRSEQIQKQFKELNIEFAVRSQQQSITEQTQVYLADTLGELNQFMNGADFVFMGGSLIKHGGQNLLEPARLGKAIVCGPHMFNFTDETELLIKHKACIQVNDINELEEAFIRLLDQPEICQKLGAAAKATLNQQDDILHTYLSLLVKPS